MNQKHTSVAVLGATGYIGARLVPKLLESGLKVRAIGRNPDKLKGRIWSNSAGVETVFGDVFDMNPNVGDFAEADRIAAKNMVEVADRTGVRRIIFLAGLGEENVDLSHHLKSRREVEQVLRSGNVPVTTLRAAMIIGSGSASFEILRYLVERLPVMVTPKWIFTECQPIAVRNVLHYLVACLDW